MGLSKSAKAQYIKDHPGSKYAKAAKQNKQIKKQFSKHSAGSLHRELGVEPGKKLPISKLKQLANSSHPLAGRARLVVSLQGHSWKKAATATKRKRRTKVV